MDHNETNIDLSDPRLARMGEALSNLPRPTPPPDLVARTLARIASQYKPVKRVIWLLRPITHPLARVAAAAVIIYTLTPMTDLDMADPIGRNIEQSVIGRQGTDKLEGFVDNLLVRNGPSTYSQSELDAMMGVQPASRTHKLSKHIQPGV